MSKAFHYHFENFNWLATNHILSTFLESFAALTARRKGESDEDYIARQVSLKSDLERKLIVLVHSVFQALLAVGLLELRPWKPRTVGALGVIASVLNCYMVSPHSAI
jgi:hypothetical protein